VRAKLLSKEGMVRPAMLMLLAIVIGSGCDYLFQIYMGRNLGPAGYSELNALLAIFYIVVVPTQIIGIFLTRYVSKFRSDGRDGQIAWLFRRMLLVGLIFGLLAVVGLYLLAPYLSTFMALSSSFPFVILMLIVMVTMIFSLDNGANQGLQRFRYNAAYSITGPLTKLAIGITLVIAGYGVLGALGGVLMGGVIAGFVGIIGIRDYLRRRPEKVEAKETKSMLRYLVIPTVSVIASTVMLNIDIILARQYLGPTEAGIYAVASVLAKVIFYLPGGINLVLLPKICEMYHKKMDAARLVRVSAAWSLVFMLSFALIYLLFPQQILHFLYGEQYIGAANALSILGFAMTFFALSGLILNYGLAVGSKVFIAVYSSFLVVEVTLIVLFHDSATTIALNMLVTSLCLAIVSFIFMEWIGHRTRREIRAATQEM
jgi:O-antigen/teichoic acid export membrane protein